MSELEKLRQENGILKDALLFYASPETYFAIGFLSDRPSGDFADDFSHVNDEWGIRAGKKARETLEQIGLEIEYA